MKIIRMAIRATNEPMTAPATEPPLIAVIFMGAMVAETVAGATGVFDELVEVVVTLS